MSDTIKVNGSTEDRTPEQAARAAPVSLPAGSFDAEALQRDLDEAAKAKNIDKRDDLVADAIAKHHAPGTDHGSPDVQPGYKRIAVDVADLGIVEQRVVYDAAAETAEVAPASSAARNQAADTAVPASKGE